MLHYHSYLYCLTPLLELGTRRGGPSQEDPSNIHTPHIPYLAQGVISIGLRIAK